MGYGIRHGGGEYLFYQTPDVSEEHVSLRTIILLMGYGIGDGGQSYPFPSNIMISFGRVWRSWSVPRCRMVMSGNVCHSGHKYEGGLIFMLMTKCCLYLRPEWYTCIA